MKLTEIHMRDPFILPFDGKYYLFGTSGKYSWEGCGGFFCHISDDLINWSEPILCFEPPKKFWANENFWAPEVYYYKGKFYMFASFKAEGHMRAVQILVSDRPEGPYSIWSCPLTPNDWMCLDGTLYVENEVPYMVFCHEWMQIKDGEMCVTQLSDNLKNQIGQPSILFKASQTEWSSTKLHGGYITDGPFMYKHSNGMLLMIWSSFDENGYVEAVAYSKVGNINGKWQHCKTPLSSVNGGHGMIFRTFEGKLFFTMHCPNLPSGVERPTLYEIKEIDEEPYLRIICNENGVI